MAKSTIIDEGSFSTAALAKAGHDLVREALAADAPSTVQLQVDDYELKQCQLTKGEKMPECRVHVTSTGGTSMALRLCDKVGGEGNVVPVANAQEALEVARKFCKCAKGKAVKVRAKCGKKVAQSGGLGNVSTSTNEVFTPEQAAQGMLKRYSTPKVAAEMAHWHAMDYREGDPRRIYWETVSRLIPRSGGQVHVVGAWPKVGVRKPSSSAQDQRQVARRRGKYSKMDPCPRCGRHAALGPAYSHSESGPVRDDSPWRGQFICARCLTEEG